MIVSVFLCAPVINDEYYSNLISTALPEVLPENVRFPLVSHGMHRSHSPAIEEFVRVYWHTLELIIRPTVRVQHIIMVSLMWMKEYYLPV